MSWLEEDAPDYWNWSWLWITKAQLGDPTPLLQGPTRDWAVQAIARGFPIAQVITILDEAEGEAFRELDLPRLLYLRRLKTRAIDGPEFQIDTWALLVGVALLMSDDGDVCEWWRQYLQSVPPKLFPVLVRTASPADRRSAIRLAIGELNRRIKRSASGERDGGYDRAELPIAIVAVLGIEGARHVERVVAYARRQPETDAVLSAYAEATLRAGELDAVFAVGESWCGAKFDEIEFCACCLEGLVPASRKEAVTNSYAATTCLMLAVGETWS